MSGTKSERFCYYTYNEYLYTGRRLDPATGLQLNRNRFYASHLGRWVNRDPIGYEGSPWNLYEYVDGMPAISGDPFGLELRTCEEQNVVNARAYAKCFNDCDDGGVYSKCRDAGRPRDECQELSREAVSECIAGCREKFPQRDCNPSYCSIEDELKDFARDCGALGAKAAVLGAKCIWETATGRVKAVFTCADYHIAQAEYEECARNR